MKLVAIKSFTYAGKRVSAGDIFEPKTDRDAKLLVGINNARHTEGRSEAKIPAPTKKLVEQATTKPEPIIPEVKEEVKLPDPVEVVTPEAKEEVKPEAEPEKEEPKEEVKPDANANSNKRTYNKRK